jgi:hydroxypyruvate reductase
MLKFGTYNKKRQKKGNENKVVKLGMNAKEILFGAYQAALNVADPQVALPDALLAAFPQGLVGNCLVIGAGKASASMADTFEKFANQYWPSLNYRGMVVTRYDHDVAKPLVNRKITVRQAAHPVPDQACLDASQQMLTLVDTLKPGEHLIVLLSGGGSSLLTLPVPGIDLLAIKNLTSMLLKSGTPIDQMNIIRKHISQIQGGNLARKAVAKGVKVHTFIISDVVGDQPADIASGPCAIDPSTYQEALEILERFQLGSDQIDTAIFEHLQAGAQGLVPETLKASDPEVSSIQNYVYATASQSLAMAAEFCKHNNIEPIILGDKITGEASLQAMEQVSFIKNILKKKNQQPIAILSGGETTVTIPHSMKGRGGRCAEFLLALYDATQDLDCLCGLAADTDGIDGTENNAGAYFDATIIAKIHELKLNSQSFLKSHDSYGFFQKVDGLVVTGPTLTNVNDFRILLLNVD